jgi:putative addiction module component (TIGR02574 family)
VTVDQLESEVLKLSQEDRVRLAQRLIASLESEAGVEETWYDEAERRLAALRSGAAAEIPASEVFESLGLGTQR